MITRAGSKKDYIEEDVIDIFHNIFKEPLQLDDIKETYSECENDKDKRIFTNFNDYCNKFLKSGYYRSKLTSSLVGKFIGGIEIKKINRNHKPMTIIRLNNEIKEEVEVLKHFTFITLISSSLLKIPEYRGYGIVKTIFNTLQSPDGHLLLPDDYEEIYNKLKDDYDKKRLICDFIAGMTDRYVLEFYGRLKSESPQSIFKPI